MRFIVVVAIFLIFANFSLSHAQEINSFELFWPLSAGKTLESNVYWLKQAKENLRGALIFGPAPKTNYDVFLATKRLLEAEKLLKENKDDLANRTLDLGLQRLVEAKAKAETSIANKESFGKSGPTTVDRLTKMEALGLYLQSQYPKSQAKLQEFIDADVSLLAILK